MKRPWGVTLIGILFITAGAVGLIYHFPEARLDSETFLMASVRVLAIVGGIFLLLGRNWTRWLLVAWLAFHVGVSAFNSISQTLAHLALLIAIGYFLFTPPASTYFRSLKPG